MTNDFKNIIKDFKNLASKIHTDNTNVKQQLRDNQKLAKKNTKKFTMSMRIKKKK